MLSHWIYFALISFFKDNFSFLKENLLQHITTLIHILPPFLPHLNSSMNGPLSFPHYNSISICLLLSLFHNMYPAYEKYWEEWFSFILIGEAWAVKCLHNQTACYKYCVRLQMISDRIFMFSFPQKYPEFYFLAIIKMILVMDKKKNKIAYKSFLLLLLM